MHADTRRRPRRHKHTPTYRALHNNRRDIRNVRSAVDRRRDNNRTADHRASKDGASEDRPAHANSRTAESSSSSPAWHACTVFSFVFFLFSRFACLLLLRLLLLVKQFVLDNQRSARVGRVRQKQGASFLMKRSEIQRVIQEPEFFSRADCGVAITPAASSALFE